MFGSYFNDHCLKTSQVLAQRAPRLHKRKFTGEELKAFYDKNMVPAKAKAKTITASGEVEANIVARIHERFQDRAEDALKMLRTCENRALNPSIVSKPNRNGTVDVGVFQVNVHPSDKTELEKLKDCEYNIERAFKKFEAKNRTFYFWTCGHVVGDYTYVDALKRK